MTPEEKEFFAKAIEHESRRQKAAADQAYIRAAHEKEERRRESYEKQRDALRKVRTSSSEISNLLDPSLRKMIAPDLIRGLYMVGIVLWLIVCVGGCWNLASPIFKTGSALSGCGIIAAWIVVFFLGLILWRVVNEMCILFFNIYETLQEIRDKDLPASEASASEIPIQAPPPIVSTPTPGMKVYGSQ